MLDMVPFSAGKCSHFVFNISEPLCPWIRFGLTIGTGAQHVRKPWRMLGFAYSKTSCHPEMNVIFVLKIRNNQSIHETIKQNPRTCWFAKTKTSTKSLAGMGPESSSSSSIKSNGSCLCWVIGESYSSSKKNGTEQSLIQNVSCQDFKLLSDVFSYFGIFGVTYCQQRIGATESVQRRWTTIISYLIIICFKLECPNRNPNWWYVWSEFLCCDPVIFLLLTGLTQKKKKKSWFSRLSCSKISRTLP